MNSAPKSLRLHIGLFGRVNAGKSSFLNAVCGQEAAITSPVPGTTTDVVEKAMELLPVGPVVFLDTAGLDDVSELAAERIRRTDAALRRCDVVAVIVEPGRWTKYEEEIISRAQGLKAPVIIVINKTDIERPSEDFIAALKGRAFGPVVFSCADPARREEYIQAFKRELLKAAPESFFSSVPLVGDLLSPGSALVLVVPIDLQAPKGRLILPQVQTIRDALDNDSVCLVVKEREYAHALGMLKDPPALVVCDSQVVLKMTADTPASVPCTTFSILFSRYRGDLRQAVEGAKAIDGLKDGDEVLIAEACSHHAVEDDIGRVKIPRWLRQYLGKNILFSTCAGHDYPPDISRYKLIIHCGGCMINRKEMLWRLETAREAKVPVTNYGVCISHVQGVLRRVLSPFPWADF